jgi:signal transduction histidine kinase
VERVFYNLLLNAAQAMPQGGNITVSAEKVKFSENVEIKVKDTGVGIPADILPHVFEPFFTTKRGKGTGLGLSISQAYVRNHSGEIRAESIPNRGTTVRIVLPIRQEGRREPANEEFVVG